MKSSTDHSHSTRFDCFFNDWLLASGYLIIVMVPGTLLLTVVTTYAHDLHEATRWS